MSAEAETRCSQRIVPTRPERKELITRTSYEVRPVGLKDLVAIHGIMMEWMLNYQDTVVKPQDFTLHKLRALFVNNMKLLDEFVRANPELENSENLHQATIEAPAGVFFYAIYDPENPEVPLGISGLATREHIDWRVTNVLRTKLLPEESESEELASWGIIERKNGEQIPFNLEDPNAMEIYLLYTDTNATNSLGENYRGIGASLIDKMKEIAAQRGATWLALTSRAVWEETGKPFYSKRPDFIAIHDDLDRVVPNNVVLEDRRYAYARWTGEEIDPDGVKEHGTTAYFITDLSNVNNNA